MLGLGNLAGGLVLGLHTAVPNTRLVLDVVYANFGLPAAALIVYCSVAMPAVHCGLALAARVAALAVVGFMAPTLAALTGIGYQWWSGHGSLQLPLYALGLYVGCGWHLLHLGALATAVQVVVGSRRVRRLDAWQLGWRVWLGPAATVALYLGSRQFDHVLVRFGAPLWPFSAIDGYAEALGWQVVVGIYWTAFSMLLLAAAHLFPGRSSWRCAMRRVSPHWVAGAWAALLVWVVVGVWTIHQVDDAAEEIATSSRWAEASQPRLSLLDVQVDIHPRERVVVSRGAAVVVNRSAQSIAELRVGIPPGMTVHSIALTGELAKRGKGVLHYRLNRPLEPAETLRVAFETDVVLDPVPVARTRARRASSSHLRSSDILPAIGVGEIAASSRSSSGIALRARISTTADRIAVAPGRLLRHWKEEGRSYFDYRAEQAVPAVAHIHSARYTVTREQWRGISIEAYHLPAHRASAEQMIAAAKAQHERWPSPYPWLRVVEAADYEPIADAPGLLAFGWRIGAQRPWFEPLGGVLPYSELRGFFR